MDMEHLKYIFSELGETFKDAWTEINKKIPARRQIFKNPHDDGYDIPIEFTLASVEMATNIMNELIPYEIKYEYTINISQDHPPTLHGLHHQIKDDKHKKDKQPYTRPRSGIERGKHPHDKSSSSSPIPSRQSTDIFCRSYGKARRDIFKTGCDQFAIYCKCKAMDATIIDKQREETLKNFDDRQQQILSAKKRSRHSIRTSIASISNQTSPDLMQELQDELVEQYNEQYPEDTTENILQNSASDDELDSS